MSRYLPPTRVVNVDTPFKTLVVRADPDFERQSRIEPFYEFSNGRVFNEQTSKQGPYKP